MKKLKFSILMPVYNGEKVIGETLRSVLGQNFNNFELIICDDCSRDNTAKIIKGFKDSRIKYFRNKNNLGYPGNMEQCRKKASGDILYLMAQDDILEQGALLNTYHAFMVSDDIGAVTRPYFWFSRNVNIPVRAKEQLNPERDETIKINDDFQKVLTVFKTLDQFSGLALRKKFMDLPFHKDIFPCHVYPFASIFKNHTIVFLKDYNVAVRIDSSQTRSLSSIYNKSPVQSWIDMFNNVFYEKKYQKLKTRFIQDFVVTNYVGLIQIRNYAKYRYLLREIYLLIKYRPYNIFNPVFWFFSLGCMLTPVFILIPLVDWYKNNINARNLTKIKI
ncbi:MAG: glycosyltransferase family 2 protein [bacterium]|nr:glycosyltransferase family 2 protein [bacterium]